MFQTGQFSKIKQGLRSMTEKWRSKKNQTVIPAPAPKPQPPKIMVQEVELKRSVHTVESGPFNSRECISHAKMNANRKHRHQMKTHNKKQKKMNKRHGVRS